jgi:lysophospholipase L1-like esterase
MVDRRVLFFGDSLVVGVGDPAGHGWVGRVVAVSSAAGMPVTAYNLGVRAETSAQVASRWRGEARPRLWPGADTRIVVSFGANDTTIEGAQRRVEADLSCGALDTILDRAAMVGLPVLVVGPAPTDDAEQNRRIQTLSLAFGEICAVRAVSFISVLEALLASKLWGEQLASGDGAHPGGEGYDALAQLVLAGGWLDWLADETPLVHRERPATG